MQHGQKHKGRDRTRRLASSSTCNDDAIAGFRLLRMMKKIVHPECDAGPSDGVVHTADIDNPIERPCRHQEEDED